MQSAKYTINKNTIYTVCSVCIVPRPLLAICLSPFDIFLTLPTSVSQCKKPVLQSHLFRILDFVICIVVCLPLLDTFYTLPSVPCLSISPLSFSF